MFVTGDRERFRGPGSGSQAQTEPLGCDRADTGEAKISSLRQPFELRLLAAWYGEQELIIFAALSSDLLRITAARQGIGQTGRRNRDGAGKNFRSDVALVAEVSKVTGQAVG